MDGFNCSRKEYSVVVGATKRNLLKWFGNKKACHRLQEGTCKKVRSGFEQKCNLSILLALRENILSTLNNMKDFSPLFSQHGGGEGFFCIS